MTPALSDDRITDGRARLRRALSRIGLLAAVWAVILAVTNGVAVALGPIHFSSRNARNPAIGALILLAAAFLLAPAGRRRQALAGDIAGPAARIRGLIVAWPALLRAWDAATRPPLTTAFAIVLVGLTLAASWTRGVYIAGGSDSYGYVSEAHLLATGRTRADAPLMNAFPHAGPSAVTPLGYHPADDGSHTLVPMYAPGLPLTMAVAERVGGMDAVYVVMPLLAAVAVWFTYRLGTQLVGPGTGVGAALLLFTSPAFVFQLLGAPMSDVPATGWWALALSLLLRDRRWASLAAGVAAGLALLTRPNLLLVIVVLGWYLLWKAIRATDRTEALIRLVLFSLPGIAACLAVASFNAAWYGSPLRSGYSSDLFHLSFGSTNIVNYPVWLTQSQTPLLLLGLAAPFVVRWSGRPVTLAEGDGGPPRLQRSWDDRPRPGAQSAVWLLLGVAVAVFGSYVFYQPFGAWWFLRFLLPAFPPLAVLTCVVLAALADRFGTWARVLGIVAVAGAAWFGGDGANTLDSIGEYRYRIIAEWARDHLPANAVVVASQHSGNVNHYSGRPIVRYDNIAHGDYEAALDEIIRAGYHPYLVVDDWEVPLVKRQHGEGRRGALDWPPIAVLPLGNVAVWDLEDHDAARASGRTPETIPIPEAVRRRLQ